MSPYFFFFLFMIRLIKFRVIFSLYLIEKYIMYMNNYSNKLFKHSMVISKLIEIQDTLNKMKQLEIVLPSFEVAWFEELKIILLLGNFMPSVPREAFFESLYLLIDQLIKLLNSFARHKCDRLSKIIYNFLFESSYNNYTRIFSQKNNFILNNSKSLISRHQINRSKNPFNFYTIIVDVNFLDIKLVNYIFCFLSIKDIFANKRVCQRFNILSKYISKFNSPWRQLFFNSCRIIYFPRNKIINKTNIIHEKLYKSKFSSKIKRLNDPEIKEIVLINVSERNFVIDCNNFDSITLFNVNNCKFLFKNQNILSLIHHQSENNSFMFGVFDKSIKSQIISNLIISNKKSKSFNYLKDFCLSNIKNLTLEFIDVCDLTKYKINNIEFSNLINLKILSINPLHINDLNFLCNFMYYNKFPKLKHIYLYLGINWNIINQEILKHLFGLFMKKCEDIIYINFNNGHTISLLVQLIGHMSCKKPIVVFDINKIFLYDKDIPIIIDGVWRTTNIWFKVTKRFEWYFDNMNKHLMKTEIKINDEIIYFYSQFDRHVEVTDETILKINKCFAKPINNYINYLSKLDDLIKLI